MTATTTPPPEDAMNCPTCQAPHASAARFCARCGTPLHPTIDRANHFAAHPDEPVRALAVMSTLMPHLSGGRHHAYRNAVTVALLASAVAASFGVLSVALVCAAIALPAVVLTYLHDHDAWGDEPFTVIGAGFALSLVTGVAAGLLQRHLSASSLMSLNRQLPSPRTLLELGVLMPVVVLVLVAIAPMLITARARFRHPLDAVNAATISGAAFSLGLSIVIQSGSFTHAVATGSDPARTVFIAFTLGFLQPVVLAAAAAVIVMRVRRPEGAPIVGAAQASALVLAYGLATTLLAPYGSRGVVLTAVSALVLAGLGLLCVRHELQRGLLAEAQAALTGDGRLHRAASGGQICAHCHAELPEGAAFCQACGTAAAALARLVTRTRPTASLATASA